MKKSKLIMLSGAGTLFESFDYYLFALFAFELGHALYGGTDTTGILWVLIAFASGYVARIVGALFFGYIGDKYSRKLAFQYTIAIIGISSMLIAVIPPYSAIGAFAIVLLFILRIAQGFSYGGELSGAMVMVSEHSKRWRGFSCSLISLFGSLGIFVAIGAYSLIHSFLNVEQMINIGWRIAFFIGGIVIMHSYYARKALHDSPVFRKTLKDKSEAGAFQLIRKDYKWMVVVAVLMGIGTQCYTGVFVVYLPVYCQEYCTIFSQNVPELLMMLAISTAVGNVMGGLLSELIKYKYAYLLLTLLGAVIIIPAFATLSSGSSTKMTVMLALGVYAFVNGGLAAIMLRYLTEIFPTAIRYTSVSVAYNITVAIFVGFSPALLSGAFSVIHNPMLPAYILVTAYCIQVAFILLVEMRKKFIGAEIW